MRIQAFAMSAFTILALGAATAPATAQNYSPNYPVCMQVFGPQNYIDCRFTSIPQCQASASGRAAECVVNPYASNAYGVPPAPRHSRRHRHVD